MKRLNLLRFGFQTAFLYFNKKPQVFQPAVCFYDLFSSLSRKLRRRSLRVGWRSLRRALASI